MEETAWLFVQIILVEVIGVLVPVFVKALVSLADDFILRLENRLTPEQWAAVKKACDYAVYAAEQSGLADEIKADGATKKEWAIERAEKWLEKQDIFIDIDILADLIEASVGENLNALGVIEPEPAEDE